MINVFKSKKWEMNEYVYLLKFDLFDFLNNSKIHFIIHCKLIV